MGKRITIAVVLGLVAAGVCMLLTKFAAGVELTYLIVVGGVFNRTLMGFMIGATGLKMNPWLRGTIYGFLISLGWAIQLGPKTQVPFLVAGTIYGLLIDGLTSRVFKAEAA